MITVKLIKGAVIGRTLYNAGDKVKVTKEQATIMVSQGLIESQGGENE